jgi:GR25 family glycosyltransferase involved in LPS biosynthesis
MKKLLLIIGSVTFIYIIFDFSYIFKRELPKIDKTYIISLDKNQDRYQIIDKSLDNEKIKHQKFNAIDGYKVKITHVKSGQIFTGLDLKNNIVKIIPEDEYIIHCGKFDAKYRFNIATWKREIKVGEIGCSCSHLSVLQDIVKNNNSYGMIFEDDTIIPADFSHTIQKLYVPSKPFDLLYLSYEMLNGSFGESLLKLIKMPTIPFNNNVGRITSRIPNAITYLASGYIVSLEGAKKLFKYGTQEFAPSDIIYSNAIKNDYVVSIATKQFNLEQNIELPSVIETMGQR